MGYWLSMRHLASRYGPPAVWLSAMTVAAPGLRGEQGILVLQIVNTHGTPLAGVQLGLRGDGSSGAPSDSAGKIRLRLAPATAPGKWVSLLIVKPPEKYAFISPWEARAMVPPFENESDNFVPITLALRGDRSQLESSQVLASIVAKANFASAQQSSVNGPRVPSGTALSEAAKEHGLSGTDVAERLPELQISKDPYEAGMAALYAKDSSVAVEKLSQALLIRESDAARKPGAVVSAAFFLGQAQFQEGHYAAAAKSFQRSLELRPDDTVVENNLGLALEKAGDFKSAEVHYRQALAIREKTAGPDDPLVTNVENNLAGILFAKGDYAGAEAAYRKVLTIREKSLPSDDLDIALSLNNLGFALEARGSYAEAEPLLRRALAIREKRSGAETHDLVPSLNNLAAVLKALGRLSEAESLLRRAVVINQKTLTPNHPDIATSLMNLGQVLYERENYGESEKLLRQALKIDESALGPDHPSTGVVLSNLGSLLQFEQRYTEAEQMLRRALAIREKALGPENPAIAAQVTNLGSLLIDKGDLTGAEVLLQRALALHQKSLPPDHPAFATDFANLGYLQAEQHNYAAAEASYSKAIAIREKAFGTNDPSARTYRQKLAEIQTAAGSPRKPSTPSGAVPEPKP